MSATSLKLHYEPQFCICKFMDRTGTHVVFSCMCTAHCLTLTRVMRLVRRTTTLSFLYRILLIFVLLYLQLVNWLSQENRMAHLSTFLPFFLHFWMLLKTTPHMSASGSPAWTQHLPLQPGAAGRQSNSGASRWVGPGWWPEGGAATWSWSSSSCSTTSSSSIASIATSAGQHTGYGTPMMG